MLCRCDRAPVVPDNIRPRLRSRRAGSTGCDAADWFHLRLGWQNRRKQSRYFRPCRNCRPTCRLPKPTLPVARRLPRRTPPAPVRQCPIDLSQAYRRSLPVEPCSPPAGRRSVNARSQSGVGDRLAGLRLGIAAAALRCRGRPVAVCPGAVFGSNTAVDQVLVYRRAMAWVRLTEEETVSAIQRFLCMTTGLPKAG